MSKRFISIFLITIMLFINITSIGVFANEEFNFKAWDETYVVDSFKEWTIYFNEEIDGNSVDNNSVYVKNHFGEIVDTNAIIGWDNKTIIVEPPYSGYSSEYDYILYIKDIYSKSGKTLDKNIQMNFFIDDGIAREDIEYQEDVVELEEITIYDDNEYYKEIIMTLEEFKERNLQEGSIIIINPTSEDIYGYAGKIVSYRIDGENVIIETEEPLLEELFATIDLKGEQDISIEEMMNISLKNGVKAREYREYNEETHEYTEGVEYIFGSKNGDIANVGIKYGDFIIKGSIRVANPKIEFHINKPKFRAVESFYLAYNANIVSELEIQYDKSFSGDLDENIILFSYPVPLGATGLVTDFKLGVYVDGDVNSSGKMEAKVSQNTQIILGARKARNGNMEWIRNTTKEMPEFKSYIETEFKANAETGINPIIELSFFKIASVDLNGKIGPYLNLDAKTYGGGNFADGFFNGKLYTEVGVAFSSEIKFGTAFFDIGKPKPLGKTKIKVWSETREYNSETYNKLQYIKFPVNSIEMKVNETRKLEIIGAYENTVTGNTFESPVTSDIEFSLSPSDSASIDNRGNIKILSGENKRITVTAKYKGKEASMMVYVEEEQGVEPIDVSGYTNMISAGGDYTVVLKEDGTVWAWGRNSNGRLGDGHNVQVSNIPIQAIGLENIRSVSTGGAHTVVLKNNGTVWSWGYNHYGQLGDGTNDGGYIPVQAKGLDDVVAISSYSSHTVALKRDGTVWTWGRNVCGQLGDGTNEDRNTPVQVKGLNNIIAISAGEGHTIALKEDGSVWTWGNNGSGQLGDGTNEDRNIPAEVKGLNNVKAISAGRSSVILKGDGTVWHLGYYIETPYSNIEGLNNIVAISTGRTHTIALKGDGTAMAYGGNYAGQLGDGTYVSSGTPVQVKGLNNIVAVSAGSSHTIALTKDGAVWAWGANDYGQLGSGNYQHSNIPVKALIKLW